MQSFDERIVWGLELRYLLTATLMDRQRVMTVPELVAALVAEGVAISGRPSKVVSDALRWEVRKGRVVRVGRGRYVVGRMPRSTVWWIRKRVAEILERLSLQRWHFEPADTSVEPISQVVKSTS